MNHSENDCDQCGITHTSYSLQKEYQTKIETCSKCGKKIFATIAQHFKSDSPLLKEFILCIPCVLRLKEGLKTQ